MTAEIAPTPSPVATTAMKPIVQANAGPTWYADIRDMFTAGNRACMSARGLDLASYSTVVAAASDIYQQVATGAMPKGGPRWSADQVNTFLAWMNNNFPKGTPPANGAQSLPSGSTQSSSAASSATRLRKEISTLSSGELDLLKKAFNAIMARDPGDPNSYFAQAGIHWYPGPNLYCMHHVPGYNPWHRGFMYSFENALRSVPGCEGVTLPYWDITAPFPEVLKSAPFDQYVMQADASSDFPKGSTTQRFPYEQIAQNLLNYGVAQDIARALGKTDWEDFHGLFADAANNTIIQAHDSGHNSIGPTMQNQGIAAFDPIFWFFHCNWDRLYWLWQKKMSATDLHGLMTTINQTSDSVSYELFASAAVGTLNPFTNGATKLNAAATIDLVAQFDVDYAPAASDVVLQSSVKTQRKVSLARAFSIDANSVNVRVGNINRLKIPGSFSVHLQKDGKTIASQSMFQPVEVQTCANCVANAIVHFDFELPLADVAGGVLTVLVEPVDKRGLGGSVPVPVMGNPTIETHMLLHTS